MASVDNGPQADMRSLVAYCDRYAPGFAAKLIGAPQQEIQRLPALMGVELPAEYRHFMECFGATRAGSLGRFLQHTTFGLSTVEEYYRDPPEPVPANAVYLWTYEYDSPYLIYLSMDPGDGGQRPLLQFGWPIDPDTDQFTDGNPDIVVVSAGLLPYLYNEAFDRVRVPSLRFGVALEDAAPVAKPDPAYAGGSTRDSDASAETGPISVAESMVARGGGSGCMTGGYILGCAA